MQTLMDHKTTLAYLAYLGYPSDDTTDALQIVKNKRADRRKGKSHRSVFLCFVFGAAGCGKVTPAIV